MRPFNKTAATLCLVRPHPFSTLCPTPIGNSPVWFSAHTNINIIFYHLCGLFSLFYVGRYTKSNIHIYIYISQVSQDSIIWHFYVESEISKVKHISHIYAICSEINVPVDVMRHTKILSLCQTFVIVRSLEY